ncbi:glutamate-rich protein 6, partial [Biomphalaria glabrata]
LNYDQQGGIELDFTGSRRISWIWKDHETHVHAPPFQPIVFGMNYFLSVRVMSQENIALSLTGKKRSCRFNVGTKLK